MADQDRASPSRSSSSSILHTKLNELIKLGKKGLSPVQEPVKRKATDSPISETSDEELFDLAQPPLTVDPQVSRYLNAIIETKMVKAIQPFINIIRDLEATIEAKDEKIRELESQLARVSSSETTQPTHEVNTGEYTDLLSRHDKLEQHSRNFNLRISGVKCEDKADPAVLVCEIGKSMGVDVTPADFRNCHFLGRPSAENKRSVIVAFHHYPTRTRFISARKQLKTKPQFKAVYVNEDLTAIRYGVLRKLLDYKSTKKIYNCWSNHGHLYYKMEENGKPVKVNNLVKFDVSTIVLDSDE